MNLQVWILLTFLILSVATETENLWPESECVLTEWSEWSEWRVAYHDYNIHAIPKSTEPRPVSAHGVLGMADMKGMNHSKTLAVRSAISQCRDDNTCPRFLERPSEGRVDCVDGFANDLECWNVDQLSFVNISSMFYNPDNDPNPFANDHWGWTDPADAEEYCIVGLTGGTSFLRITDPENPEVLGHMESHLSETSFWRDIKVIGHYAYVVSEVNGHGIQIFDLHRLRGLTSPVMFQPDAHYDLVGNCHNVVVNEETQYVYAVACNRGNYSDICGGGLHMVNVADPLNPVFEGCYGDDGYVHDAQCLVYRGPDVRYQGLELCFCYNEDSLTIVDVTDKSNVLIISRTTYTGATYTHQGWLTEDQSVLLMDDERDERDTDDKIQRTYVWDVRDLTAPILMSTYRSPVESIDHNQYTKSGYTFQANLASGLRILYIDQQNFTISLTGYYDAMPGLNEAKFMGAWNAYPYYDSGIVTLSVAEYGLFILRPNFSAMAEESRVRKQYAEKRRFRDLISGSARDCPPLTDVRRTVV